MQGSKCGHVWGLSQTGWSQVCHDLQKHAHVLNDKAAIESCLCLPGLNQEVHEPAFDQRAPNAVPDKFLVDAPQAGEQAHRCTIHMVIDAWRLSPDHTR